MITTATTAKVTGTGINGAEVEVYKATRSANGSNSGLPSVYLGTAIVSTNGTWNLPVSGLSAGDAVTALQIRKDQNTSVLGVNVQVGSAPAARSADRGGRLQPHRQQRLGHGGRRRPVGRQRHVVGLLGPERRGHDHDGPRRRA